ncbi:MAG: polyprenyl synthetase family protein [Myxococcales bacterium]|jgi:octaprenyl-diphosphate synthase|nr:polyprenyl synthetase family protein [Myxococcales bacterium]
MSLPLDAALTHLSIGAQARQADAKLQDRLLQVQQFVGRDLAEVERLLAEAVASGPEPAASAARHLVAHGGKRVRPVALLLAAQCFGEVTPAVRELGTVVELVHSATLLHDDVVDEGMERRGVATARMRWGNGVSVLAGDLLLVEALQRTEVHAPDLLGALVGTLRRLVNGEIVQLRGRTELDVTEETYERVLRDKTASLFAFATRVGARLGGGDAAGQAALAEFGEALGIAFQLVDDVIDYQGEATGKTLFADLGEGKLTLPLVLAVAAVPGLDEDVRRVHGGDRSLVASISRRVIESGACEEVRRRARQFTTKAIDALRPIEESPARRLLEVVAHQLAARVS